jgi:hypothetical protein
MGAGAAPMSRLARAARLQRAQSDRLAASRASGRIVASIRVVRIVSCVKPRLI